MFNRHKAQAFIQGVCRRSTKPDSFFLKIRINFNSFYLLLSKDIIAGDIIINSSSPAVHSGIYLTLDGMVNINLSTKNVGVFEAFYNSAKVM